MVYAVCFRCKRWAKRTLRATHHYDVLRAVVREGHSSLGSGKLRNRPLILYLGQAYGVAAVEDAGISALSLRVHPAVELEGVAIPLGSLHGRR